MKYSTLGFWIGVTVLTGALGIGFSQEIHLARATAPTPQSAGCQVYFKRENLCGAIEWVQKPVRVAIPTEKDQAAFTLRFWDRAKATEKGPFQAPPGDLKISLWMPAMGHGSELPLIARDPSNPGIFHVSRVLFSMGGDWEIWVSLLKGDRSIDKAKIDYHLE